MRMITTFSLLLCLFTGSTYSQGMDYPVKVIEKVELIALYTLLFQQDSLNAYDIREEKMVLFLGKTTSKLLSKNNFLAIELFKSLKTETDLQAIFSNRDMQPPISRFRYEIFKNYPKGMITTLDYVLPDNFRIQEQIPLMKWDISEETSKLREYVIQKATTSFGGRKWVAWFAPGIPFGDGPYKFSGLPGLIVKLYDTRNHDLFELESIEIVKGNQQIEYPIKRHIDISNRDFLLTQEAFRIDIINRAADAGLSSHSQQVAAENMRRRNNPIELTSN